MSDESRPGCRLCPDDIPRSPLEILDHFRLLHPDVYGEGPERWPDARFHVKHPTPTEGQ